MTKRLSHLGLAAAGLLALGLAGCGANSSRNSSATTATPAPVAAAKPVHTHLYMTILTGKMIKKPGWPMYYPADFKVPADATVTVEIKNFDDGTAPLPAGSPYTKVTGVKGDQVTVTTGTGAQKTATEISSLPANQVSHTFTVSGLKLNVPVPASSTVRFTFKTPKTPGTYRWQCEAPCGTGPNGMGGAMMTDGYMMGKMIVQ